MIKITFALTLANTIFILLTRISFRRAIKFQHQINDLIIKQNKLITNIITGAVNERARKQNDKDCK